MPLPLKATELKGADSARVFRCALFDRRIQQPIAEYQFAKPRRWRFDYAWPDAKVALEVDGGVWSRGRHVRGSGFLKDMEKLNRATVLGWRVIRTTPDRLCSEDTINDLRALLKGEEG